MNYIHRNLLVFAIYSTSALAQEGAFQSVTLAFANGPLTLRCEGTVGSSKFSASLNTMSENQVLLTQKLDDFDDCGQAAWLTEKVGDSTSSTLALLNPGRLGLNAQYSAFLVKNESVTFAGYLPVSAEKVGGAKFRSYSTDGGSIWERTDSLVSGKFKVTDELQLIYVGSVCVDKSGKTQTQQPCSGTYMVAKPGKPICIRYRSHVGQLLSTASCAHLAKHF